MHTAIHHRRRIAGAQNRLLRRVRQELRSRIPDVVVGFQGGQLELPAVFANSRIWFAHQPLENAPIPRYWNALGNGRQRCDAPMTLRWRSILQFTAWTEG